MDILSGGTTRQAFAEYGGEYKGCTIATPCRSKCGELYCSADCAQEHWNNGHKCLCTGQIPAKEAEGHPLVAFKRHACATNEIFLLVADVFARICCEVDSAKANGVEFSAAVDTAMSPFVRFVRGLWWDAAIPPDNSNPEAFKDVLSNLVHESYDLLSSALDLVGRGLDKCLDSYYFSQTIGMFEQNNVGIRLENPIHKYVDSIISTRECKDNFIDIEKLSQKIQAIVDKIEDADCCEEEEEEEGEGEGEMDVNQAKDPNPEVVANDDNDECYIPFLNIVVSKSKIGMEATDRDTESDTESDNESQDSHEKAEEDAPDTIDIYDDAGIFNVDAAKRKIRLLIDQLGKDMIFPPLDGTAFYTLICKVNHSCEPKAYVKYVSHDGHGLVAEMHMMKQIDAGEELTISYIDESKSYKKRAKLLRDYGFSCTCIKCDNQRQSIRSGGSKAPRTR